MTRIGPLAAVVACTLLVGCGRNYFLWQQEREITGSTRAIAAARDDAGRARGHAARGRAYSEKARYSRAFKLIETREYLRLFDLAVQDHDQAIALQPGDADLYSSRGHTYYDRAALEQNDKAPAAAAMFDAAKADFTRTIEKAPGNAEAFDMRGLIHVSTDSYDEAISDFTREMAIDPHLGKLRLADAYCLRGSSLHRTKTYDLAVADYEKSIALGVPADSCECQPDNPLASLYFETGQYDKSWQVISRARKTNRWIAPELVDELTKASGRKG